jgi:predicted transcriptional regulator
MPKLLSQKMTTLEIQGESTSMKNERHAFILISDEKYWNRLRERNRADREVHAFVRKNLVGPREAQTLLFYVKKPIMQVRGVADFVERLTGDREELWRKYGAESCFESFDEYVAFAKGREKMTFVRFKNFTELENPKPTEIIRSVLGSLQGFRGKYVSLETAKQLTT